MKDSKVKDNFKRLVVEMEKAKNKAEDSDFLEKLRKLTGHETIEKMVKRFKKLAGL